MTTGLKSTGLVSLLICAATIAGCASIPAPAGKAVLGAPSCTPERQVNVNASVGTGAASVMVNPEPVPVKPGGGGIRWTLHAQGPQNLAFTSDGIVFASGAPPGAASNSSGPSQYLWCFAPTASGSSWKYTIKFVDTAAPSKVWSCDPTVVSSDGIMLGMSGAKTYTCY
jgi:hypothetical protein